MVSKIREHINGNGTIKGIIVTIFVGIASWVLLTIVNIPSTYVCKAELKETRVEIKENRTKEIKSLEKLMETGFKNIEKNMVRQEKKIDKLSDHLMNGE